MAKYLVLWSASQTSWPGDPSAALAVLEGAARAVAEYQKSGAITEIGWLTAQEGYAMFEARSKEQVLGWIHAFYPYYRQVVHEVVPWEHGIESILSTARQLAAK